jgi:hypothetical protein
LDWSRLFSEKPRAMPLPLRLNLTIQLPGYAFFLEKHAQASANSSASACMVALGYDLVQGGDFGFRKLHAYDHGFVERHWLSPIGFGRSGNTFGITRNPLERQVLPEKFFRILELLRIPRDLARAAKVCFPA